MCANHDDSIQPNEIDRSKNAVKSDEADRSNGTESADDTDQSHATVIDRDTPVESLDSATVRPIVKLFYGIASLVFLLVLVSLLPGMDRLVPATPITVGSLVVALVTLAIVAMLVTVAPRLEPIVREELAGPVPLATTVAGIITHLILLLAVLVAYQGLSGVFVPFLVDSNMVWVYDLSFLVLAAIPTARIAIHLYRGLDPAADFLTHEVIATAESDTSNESKVTSADGGADDR